MSEATVSTPLHEDWFSIAARVTTPVTTYVPQGDGGVPIWRGTGFFLKHNDRHFVVTNTHVLESYLEERRRGGHVCVQVSYGDGMCGAEIHDGYLLTPDNIVTSELGVDNRFAHRDIGLIELSASTASLVRTARSFVASDELDTVVPTPGTEVFFKGYPARSVYPSEIDQTLYCGNWFNVRAVSGSSQRLIVSQNVTWYREQRFKDEDSRDLRGVSGSALFSAATRKVVGVVWGVHYELSVDFPVYAATSATLLELLAEYESRRR